jgi:hypothetical protein
VERLPDGFGRGGGDLMALRAVTTTGRTLSGARFPYRSTAAPRDVAASAAKPSALAAGLLPVGGRARPAIDIPVIEPDAAQTDRTALHTIALGPDRLRSAVRVVQLPTRCLLSTGMGQQPALRVSALSCWFVHGLVVSVAVTGSHSPVRAVCGTRTPAGLR